MVSQEMMERLLKGTESVAKVAAGVAPELMSEALNLFIANSVLSILKTASVFVLTYIVKRYCASLMVGAKETEKKMFRGFETATLVLSLAYFIGVSFPHIQMITKVIVAPRMVLAEKVLQLGGKK